MNRQEGTDPTGRVNVRSSKCRSGVVGVGVSGAYPHSNRQVVAGDIRSRHAGCTPQRLSARRTSTLTTPANTQ